MALVRGGRRLLAALTVLVVPALVVVAITQRERDGDGGAAPASNAPPSTAPPESVSVAGAQAFADQLAVKQLTDYVTQSFAAGPDQALAALAASDYLVWSGSFTPEQCIRGFRRQLSFLLPMRQTWTPRLDTLAPAENANLLGRRSGRHYEVDVEVVLENPATGERIGPTVRTLRVVVVPDGTAKHGLRCGS